MSMKSGGAAAGQTPDARTQIIRVESAEPYGWVVYIDGQAKTHLYRSRPVALANAREIAQANRPSIVLISNLAGHLQVNHVYHDDTDLQTNSG